MRPLSGLDVVRAWETGQDRHPVDRALLLLALACPDQTQEQLTVLSIGQRNGRLLELRGQTLGSTLNGYAECPVCSEALEFTVQVSDLRLPEPQSLTGDLIEGNYAVAYRLPNSLDLAALAEVAAADGLQAALLERCILEAWLDGEAIAASELPDTVVAAVMDALSDHDPQADVRFRLSCPACGHNWSALFDIVSYFWTEIGAYAQRLMREAAVLAGAYGWREVDILAMSSARRKFYLDLVGS